MAFSNGMKVLEQCRISPAACYISRMSMPLTFFDLMWIPFHPVQRLLFYQLDCCQASFTHTILPNLKTSLSLTLNHFFPIAGNLTWPLDSTKPEILYLDGDSVSLTVCESDGDFGHLVGNQVRNADKVLAPLSPQILNMSTKKNHFPVVALQVTLFPNQGICIGITFHHTVADGKAVIQFVKSWASVSCSQGDTSFLADAPLCYDRTTVKDPNGIDMKYLDHFKKNGILTKEAFDLPRKHATHTEKVLATFVLGQLEIKRLKTWFSEKKGMDLSTFVIASAYTWVCWVKARRGEDATDDGMEGFVFPIDCRERLDPPIPPNYFGNCVEGGMARRKTSDLVGKDGIVIAAEVIRNVIMTSQGNDKILKYMESVFSMISSIRPDRLLTAAGSTRYGVYEINFGWGNPKKSEVASIVNTGAVCFGECPSEAGAVEISLALNPIKMEAFASFFSISMEGIP